MNLKKLFNFGQFKSKLTTIGAKEPIHIISLVIIIAIDIFVLTNLFAGIYLQSDQLDSPREQIPYSCTKYINNNIDLSKIRKASISEKSHYFSDTNNKYASSRNIINNSKDSKINPLCVEIFNKAIAVHNDFNVLGLQEKIDKEIESISNLDKNNYSYRNSYDTMLLERIANQNKKDSIIKESAETVKNKIYTNEKAIQIHNNNISEIEDAILNKFVVKDFLITVSNNKEELLSTAEFLRYWYPLKIFFVRILFSLPLFLILLWFYKRNKNKEQNVISLLNSHLLLISLFPILSSIIIFVVSIMPHRFFSDLLELLEALNIVSVFNYLLIFIGIGVGIGVITFLQKIVFSKEATWKKRLSKNECWSCGYKKENTTNIHCPHCGEVQKIKCSTCNEIKLNKALFCNSCGVKNENQ